jgi:uncharacterized lipoprotein (TIGR02269 family)
MNLRPRQWLLLLSVLLVSCASPLPRAELSSGGENPWACGSPVAPSEEASIAETFRLCESSENASCFSLTCNEVACTLFRYESHELGRIVPTRGGGFVTPGATAQRYWAGILLRSPQDKPVFIIPWDHHKPLLPSQKKMLEEALKFAQEPHEKHHIFTQEQPLKEWFEAQGINIHDETMLLDIPTHRRIHLGPRGGPWNQAWRDFRLAKPLATKKEMYDHAWELIKRFNLVGFIVPYYGKPPYLLPPPIEY